MKKVLCLVVLVCILTGCGSGQTEIEYDGHPVVVDDSLGVVTYQTDTYAYSAENNELRITYPDGVLYVVKFEGNTRSEGSSGEIDTKKYLPPQVLVDALEADSRSDGIGFFPVVALVLGLVLLLFPKGVWQVTYGLVFKGAQITTAGRYILRIIGICIIIFAAGIFLTH